MYTNRRDVRSLTLLLIATALALTGCGGSSVVTETTSGAPAADSTTPTTSAAPVADTTTTEASTTTTEASTTTQATDDPSVLNGTYQLEWTPQDLSEAMGEEDELNSGVYQLVLEAGEFDQVWDNAASAGDHCPGTYVVRGNRLLMTATTNVGDWDCGVETVGQEWLDAAWELDGDQLILSDFAPTGNNDLDMWMEIYLGTKPLTRIDEP